MFQTIAGKPMIKTLSAGGTVLSTGVTRQGLPTVTTTQGGKQTIVIAAPRSGASTVPGQQARIVTTVPKTAGTPGQQIIVMNTGGGVTTKTPVSIVQAANTPKTGNRGKRLAIWVLCYH